MANLLDDLKGILSPAEYAKIEGNAALKTRASKASELLEWYGGEEEPATTTTTTTTVQPAATTTVQLAQRNAPNFDLSSIETMLDKKLSTLNTTIDTKIGEVVKQRGDELVNNAVKIALQRSDELNRIYMEHQANFSEAFDTTKFNEFLEANKDKGFRTIRQGYDAFIGPRAEDARVQKRVKEELAKQSGNNVPGTTPPPSANAAILHFKKRTVAGDGTATTGAQRAAALLDKRMAEASA